jgi:TonB family protein
MLRTALYLGVSLTVAIEATADEIEGCGPPPPTKIAQGEPVRPVPQWPSSTHPRLNPNYNVKPDYPASLLGTGKEGAVILRVDVDKDGMPLNAMIVDAPPEPEFAAAALAHLSRLRFCPATRNGEPVFFSGHEIRIVLRP